MHVGLVGWAFIAMVIFMRNSRLVVESVILGLESHYFGLLAIHTIYSFDQLREVLLLVLGCSVLLARVFLAHLLKIVPSLIPIVDVGRNWSLLVPLLSIMILLLIDRCFVVRKSILALGLTVNRLLWVRLSQL
jgi:hypothetical protein